jgi:hypothetical protein
LATIPVVEIQCTSKMGCSGTVPLSSGPSVIVVRGDGNWTLAAA